MSLLWKTVSMRLTQRTAKILNTRQEDLRAIAWANGEANLDSELSHLACRVCVEAWDDIKVEFPEYQDLSLKATDPDVTLEFLRGLVSVFKAKIELKSGKGMSIPGSTIGKLDVNIPVICVRRDADGLFVVGYQQYHALIGETDHDLFQDRTPRPHVNFTKMADPNITLQYIEKEKGDWINHFAECAVNRIHSPMYKDQSWQDDLTRKIIDEFIKRTSVDYFVARKTELS